MGCFQCRIMLAPSISSDLAVGEEIRVLDLSVIFVMTDILYTATSEVVVKTIH